MERRRPDRQARYKSRTAAASLAVLLHVGVVLAVLATSSGTLPHGASDPFGEGEAISVSLAGREGAAGERPSAETRDPPAETDRMDQMAQRLRAERSDLFASEAEPSRPRGSLTALFQSIGRLSAPGRQGDSDRTAGRTNTRGDAALTTSASREGAPSPADGSRGLWGQVEPCWRKLAPKAAVPVTLKVTLDDFGRLAAPPKILRPPIGRPDEQRLLSEALALQAIQACLPYRVESSAALNREYQLVFGG